jgi:multiple antibiotic resistance protein
MLDFAVTAFVSILFLVDPPGTVPAFVSLTSHFTPERRKKTALLAAITATCALMIFAAIGKVLFRALGLTLPAFQIAGGIILFLEALKMIQANNLEEESQDMKDAEAQLPLVAITPLAIPFLAGPAAMSTVTMLIAKASDWAEIGLVHAAIMLTGLISYLCLRLAEPIQKRLGKIGIHVLGRVLGLVLAGIAVQFVLDGLTKAKIVPVLAP